MSALITVKNLSKVYRLGHEKVKALDGINLEINKGEICCILGTSGSGKSTLLNQLAGLERPTSGDVHIGKVNISRMSEDQLAGFRQRYIGFVFQSYNLLASLTAAENVAMPLLFRGVERRHRDSEAAAMLKKVGLGNRMRHKPSEMSGGQQQRVGIARAFVAKPKIVFADEPTGNLDSHTTIEVMNLIVDMSREHGITFVLVTHDRELSQYANRIITLMDGQIVSDVINEKPSHLINKSNEEAPEDSPEEAAEGISPEEQEAYETSDGTVDEDSNDKEYTGEDASLPGDPGVEPEVLL